MALYLITRTDDTDYDEYTEVVVRAGSEKEALALVCRADEPYLKYMRSERPAFPGFRIDGLNARVEKIPVTGDAEVIASVFRAG